MALSVQNLTKKYGEKVVVDNLSFEMNKPGVFALLGTNGAGKTTTIRIILGMLSYNSGKVLWDGKPFDAINMSVGYLAEERGLYPKYSLLDQLLYFAKLRNVPKKEAIKRIKYWSERLLVEEYIFPPKTRRGRNTKSNRAEQLSKGNQQKIQLMAALLADPQFLILDEATSAMDRNTENFTMRLLQKIKPNCSILFISHRLNKLKNIADIIYILEDKTISKFGNHQQLMESSNFYSEYWKER